MREVSLGVPGSWADDNLETCNHYTTKVGGLPDWPFSESCLRPELLLCNSCRKSLCLVAQVYAPVSTAALKIGERIIYVFGCTVAHCGSWRAIRVQKPDTLEEPLSESVSSESEVPPSTVSASSASESKWWDDLYSFEPASEDTGENEVMSMEDLAMAFSEAANVSSSSVKKGSRRHSESYKKALPLVPKSREVDLSTFVLPCFYICYQEDKSCQHLAPACPSKSSLSVDKTNQEEAWEEESYEYDKAMNADRTYLKFKKRVDGCPEQCFRYAFGGKPLLATGNIESPGPCGQCGESRHYEMQVMPPLVYFLQEGATGAQRDLVDSWNWLTLMVFTCSKSCFQKLDHEKPSVTGWSVVEETVIAQLDKPLTDSARLGYLS